MIEPTWVIEALIRINKLPENSPRDKAKHVLARRIIRGLEMDDIPTPDVWRESDGAVHILFSKFDRKESKDVEFFITRGDMFQAQQCSDRVAKPRRWQCMKRYEETAREIMSWLYEDRNAADYGEMAKLLEVGA